MKFSLRKYRKPRPTVAGWGIQKMIKRFSAKVRAGLGSKFTATIGVLLIVEAGAELLLSFLQLGDFSAIKDCWDRILIGVAAVAARDADTSTEESRPIPKARPVEFPDDFIIFD